MSLNKSNETRWKNIDSTCSELLSRHQSFFATFEVEKNYIDLLYRNVGLFGVPDNATLNAIRIAENNALESIGRHCNHLVEWQNYFLTFEATARTLHNSGCRRSGSGRTAVVACGRPCKDNQLANTVVRTEQQCVLR